MNGDAAAAAPAPAAKQPSPRGREAAAVALLLHPLDELRLLMIRRAEKETDPWSGHVALPGGRRERHDPDLLRTARRETREEVGLDPGAHGMLLGRLPDVRPSGPNLPPLSISAFVFAVDPPGPLELEPREVESAFWVPLSALRDEESISEVIIEVEGTSRSFPAITYGEYVVWGLTLRILEQFMDVARQAGV